MANLPEWNCTYNEIRNHRLYDSGYDSDDDSNSDEQPCPRKISPGDLTNSVHPVFARHNFPCADYDKLLSVLRLASRLIDTDCLLDFWHAIFFGEIVKVFHGDDPDDWHLAYFRRYEELSAKARSQTRLSLLALSYTTSFHRSTLKGWNGLACPGHTVIGGALGCAAQHVPGRCTEIRYSEEMYERLCKDESDSLETRLRTHFSFAALLVHELMHAACYAAVAPGDEMIPFEYNTMAEEGFEWEAFTFGGILNTGSGEQTFTEWPSPHAAKYYLSKSETDFWTLEDPSDIPDVEARWFIPIEYVEKLFTTSFWEETLPKEGAQALKIPRSVGQLYVLSPSGSTRYYNEFEPDLVPDLEIQRYVLPDDVEYVEFCEIRAIAPGFEWEGFGRLMKIDIHGVFKEEYPAPDPWSSYW